MKIFVATLSDNFSSYFFNTLPTEKRKLLIQTITNLFIDYAINLNHFDRIMLFYHGEETKRVIDSKENDKLISIHSQNYFSRNIDDLLFAKINDFRKYVHDDDWIFVTHMDYFASRDIINSLPIPNDQYKFFACTNDYVSIMIGSTKYPWYADQFTYANVKWLRDMNVLFSWNQCYAPEQNKYLDLAKKPIKVGVNSYERNGKNLAFDGLVEGSLILAIKQDSGEDIGGRIKNLGEGNTNGKKQVHLKSFFSQCPTSWRGVSNWIITKHVILDYPFDFSEYSALYPKQMTKTVSDITELKDSIFYTEVMNRDMVKRYDAVLEGLPK